MPMPIFLSTFLLLFALISNEGRANAAEPVTPEWRRSYDNQWCFETEYRSACLPIGFELTRFETDFAWWHQWRQLGHVIQIKYDAEAPEYDDSILASECLVLVSSFGTRYVQITELATDETKEDSHHVSLFVAVFDDQFSITVSGTDSVRMRWIINSLTDQWNANG